MLWESFCLVYEAKNFVFLGLVAVEPVDFGAWVVFIVRAKVHVDRTILEGAEPLL